MVYTMAGVVLLAALLLAAFVIYSSGPYSNLGANNENPPKELVSKTDSLKAVVSDLEAKIEILNRYLVQKNLEYIDACDLKTKP